MDQRLIAAVAFAAGFAASLALTGLYETRGDGRILYRMNRITGSVSACYLGAGGIECEYGAPHYSVVSRPEPAK